MLSPAKVNAPVALLLARAALQLEVTQLLWQPGQTRRRNLLGRFSNGRRRDANGTAISRFDKPLTANKLTISRSLRILILAAGTGPSLKSGTSRASAEASPDERKYPGMPGEIAPESWAASDRNGGRVQPGISTLPMKSYRISSRDRIFIGVVLLACHLPRLLKMRTLLVAFCRS